MAQESLFGSLQFGFVILVFTLCVGVLYVGLSWLLSVVWSASYYFSSAVGFSGVLFAMAVDEASLSAAPTRSVFGLFSVPTAIYPWVLMLLLQFLLPNVSLVGHLAGILVGFAHTRGALAFLVPSFVTLRKLEEAPCMARIVRLGPYKMVPNAQVLRETMTVRCVN